MDFDDHNIHGYDVSFWQILVDFFKMKESGAQFCGVKVGQANYADPDFKYNWTESKKAGLVRFGYWFCDADVKPKIQAQKYWELLEPDFDNEMQFADYENGSWTDWWQLYTFMNEFQRLSGLPDEKIGVYTGYPWFTSHSPSTKPYKDFFARHPLFLAWYTDNPSRVTIPSPWQEVLLWQDGTPVIDVGQKSPKIDHDKFNGDMIKFKKYFGSASVVKPPVSTFPSSVFIGDKQYKGVV